jgi:hypothetical protein
MGGQSSTMSYNFFNFIFFFPWDKFRWWCREVPAVDLVFLIRGEERNMEYIVNFPGLGKLELVDNGG